MTRERKLTPEEIIAFEKVRLEYCAKIYEREAERKEILERKSQFYLSFVSVFLGAVFLNLDFLKSVNTLITQKSIGEFWIGSIYFSLIALSVSIIISIFAVFESMRLQKYKNEYPVKVISSLFAPDSKYLEDKDESSFLKATALSYTIALETNKKINDQKATWIKVSSFGVFIAITSLGIFLAIVAYLSLLA